jgi:predicted ABC-type ATPase
MPTLHLLAGPEGAGKATLYRTLIAPRYPQLAWADNAAGVQACLELGRSFALASPFGDPSPLDVLADARGKGFECVLYVLCVDDPRLLQARVKQRAAEGGRSTPAHEVLARYSGTLTRLQEALALADLSLLFDAGDAESGGPTLVASIAAGRLHLHLPLRPRWADKLLGFAER